MHYLLGLGYLERMMFSKVKLITDRNTKVFYALTKFNTNILYSQNMIVRLVTFG